MGLGDYWSDKQYEKQPIYVGITYIKRHLLRRLYINSLTIQHVVTRGIQIAD